ncbi:MAG: hypothetical protein ACQES5_11675 [Thermodesulfobacteriota bacterium]
MHRWLIIFGMIFFAGCGMWDGTRDAYYEHVYPTPEIDLEFQGLNAEQEEKLARIFYPADTELSALLRHLQTRDKYPRDSWFDSTLRDFPWLGGVLAVDAEGEILKKVPREGIKKIDYSFLAESEVHLGDWRTRTFIRKTAFGPEIILARPFFKGSEWKGMIVFHFDPRVFAELSSFAPRMTLVMESQVLWSSELKKFDRYLENRPWDELIKSEIHGRFKPESAELFWMARRVGDKWLFYVVRSGEIKK